MKNYLSLEKLDTYKLAKKLSDIVWKIFEKLDYKGKKLFGYQFVEATESVGANIAEGYGRFHYLDKVKFYYNSRGSLLESRHWFDVLIKRKKLIDKNLINEYLDCYKELRLTLNGFIKSNFMQKKILNYLITSYLITFLCSNKLIFTSKVKLLGLVFAPGVKFRQN